MMILQLAWRNIWRNPVRSLVIIISVAAGLLAAIAVMGIYDGMMVSRKRIVIYSETGHLQVHDPKFKDDMEPAYVIKDLERWKAMLAKDTMVSSLATRVVTMGMLTTPTGSAGVQVTGIDSTDTVSMNRLLVTGYRLQDGKSILAGKKLCDKLKLSKGDKIVLTMTDRDGNMISTAMRIRGIYETSNTPLDELIVYVKGEPLAELLGVPGQAHELVIIAKSDDSVTAMQRRYMKAFPAYKTESWKELSPETDLMIKTVDYYSYIIVIIILIALSFGIINTMMMSVLERKKEIGMMAALGIGKRRVLLMIIFETIFLTVVGIPLAMLLGWVIVGYYHRVGIDLSGVGEDVMKSFGFENVIYPIYPADKLPAVIALVFISAMIASVFPSLKGIRIKPSEALQK